MTNTSLSTMQAHLTLHWQYIKLKIAERMAYRFDFFTSLIAYFLWQFVAPVVALVMYYAGGRYPGWTIEQVIVLQGTLALISGFSFMLLFGIVWNSEQRIRNGEFDLLLFRPVNVLWLLIMDSFDQEDIGQFLGGIVLTCIGLSLVGGMHGSLLLYITVCLLGVLFFFSLALLCSALSIKFIHTRRLYEFISIIKISAGYPRTLYHGGTLLVFTLILPLFIAGHYPAAALLGLEMGNLVPSAVATVLFAALCLWVWHKTLRSYKSAGG